LKIALLEKINRIDWQTKIEKLKENDNDIRVEQNGIDNDTIDNNNNNSDSNNNSSNNNNNGLNDNNNNNNISNSSSGIIDDRLRDSSGNAIVKIMLCFYVRSIEIIFIFR
jgi:hypothetical protein